MKKNFVKKLAVALSLAMAVTTIAPANYASAAAAPTFKSASVKVKVGDTKKYSTTNAKKYSVKFKIGNKAVATIKYSAGSKSVKVTGVAEGKTTLRADFKSYKTKKTTTVKVPVTVVPNETTIKAVAQTAAAKLTATFSGDATEVKAENLSIVRDNDSVVVPIKSVAVDTTDKTKVTIETYSDMKDGKTYTVTFNEKSKAQFTASTGDVVDAALDTYTVNAGKATKVQVQLLDANGVVLNTATLTDASTKNVEYTIEATKGNGYTEGDKYYLPEVGDTAKAKVVYHTWKYDDAGNETGKFEKEFTITAVKDATTVSNFTYTIATKTPAWTSSSFKASSTISANDNANVYFLIKDSNGDEIDYAAYEYTVASSDTTKLIVDETAITANTVGIPVVGVAAGSAYILVKDKDGNTVKTLPVTVQAKRKATTLEVDSQSFTLSTTAADVKTVALTVKDQYGDKVTFPGAGAISVEVQSSPSKVTAAEKAALESYASGVTLGAAANELDFTATAFPSTGAPVVYKTGTYAFKITVDMGNDVKVTRTITVSLKTAGAASKYDIDVAGTNSTNNTFEVTKKDAVTADTLTFTLMDLDASGVLVGATGGTKVADWTIKHSDGTLAQPKTIGSLTDTLAVTSVTSGAIVLDVKTGSYTVTAEIRDTAATDPTKVIKTVVKNFRIEDGQVKPSVTVKDNSADDTIANAIQNTDKVVFSYDGSELEWGTDINFVKANLVTTGNAGNKYVKSVVVDFVAKTTDATPAVKIWRRVTVDVNKTFTNVQ